MILKHKIKYPERFNERARSLVTLLNHNAPEVMLVCGVELLVQKTAGSVTRFWLWHLEGELRFWVYRHWIDIKIGFKKLGGMSEHEAAVAITGSHPALENTCADCFVEGLEESVED